MLVFFSVCVLLVCPRVSVCCGCVFVWLAPVGVSTSEHFDSRRPRRRFISCRPATVPGISSLGLRLFHIHHLSLSASGLFLLQSPLSRLGRLMLYHWSASARRVPLPPMSRCESLAVCRDSVPVSDQFRCFSFVEFVVVARVRGAPERARASRCRSIRCPSGVRAFDLSIAFVPHMQPSWLLSPVCPFFHSFIHLRKTFARVAPGHCPSSLSVAPPMFAPLA